MTTAAPPRPTDTTAAIDAEFEALIREARRHARRRRSVLLAIGIAAVALVVGAFAMFLAPLGGQRESPPPEDVAQGDDEFPAARPIADDPQLIASMHLHHMSSAYGDFWMYLFSDGRLLQSKGDGFVQQRLTEEGLALVRDTIVTQGLVGEERSAGLRDEPGCCGFIQVRKDGDLVVVPYSRDFYVLVDRLVMLQSWLPATVLFDADLIPYEPQGYAVCGWALDGSWSTTRGDLNGLARVSPRAAMIIEAAPTLPTVSPDADRGYRQMAGGTDFESGCRQLSAEQARELTTALTDDGWTDPPGSDKGVEVMIIPLLPHGAPALTPG